MLTTIPHTTTDYTYFDAGGVTFAVPYESTTYDTYVVGGVCDGERVGQCREHLLRNKKKELLESTSTEQSCVMQGFVWDKIDKFPQIPSASKPHCELIYQQSCFLTYEGDEPVSANCFWDKQNLARLGKHLQIKAILDRARNRR
jgi:hypothetical protein